MTTRTPSVTFASGVSTATPRLRATRRDATSHMRRRRASFGPSEVDCPIAPAMTSAAGVIPCASLRCDGKSAPKFAKTFEALDWFMFNH
ncbi:MAG: hypothetical protein CMB70_03620 [Euryarchaeota archaeon]|nr:hypothetical protein [Euryarchaeota archaeon]